MENLSKGKLALIALGIWIAFSFGGGTMSVVGFWVGFIFFVYGLVKSNGNNKKALSDERQKEDARVLVEKIKLEKKLEPISTTLFLDKNENAFFKENTVLMEARAVRQSVGGGVGFRVMKGVYVGGYRGQSESNQELRAIESGDLIVTNKKLVFRGTKENRVIPLSSIIEIKMHSDAIEIATTGRQKSSIFTTENPYLWNVNLFILSKVENPLDFSGINNIDIAIS